jgi:glycosyltransferase involved in cell wall biosynthesis
LKPKILITVPDLNLAGGVAIMFRALQKHFSPDVDYFTIGKRSGENSAFSKIKRIIGDYRNYRNMLIHGTYDVVQINPSLKKGALIRDALFLIFAKMNGKKVVVFFHGWDWELAYKLSKGLLHSIFKWIYFSADGIVVLASAFAEKIKDMGYNGCLYLGNVAIEDSISQLADLPVKRRQNPEKDFNILFLTRIEKYKGIYEAIEAFKIIKARYLNVRLTIAGDGGELKNVRRYVKENEIHDVEFTGHVAGIEKHEVFKKADCYLFPSYSEGMPLSLIEAFAYGLPVITSPVGAIKDFFINEKMGFLTDGLDANQIVNLIGKCIDNPELCFAMGQTNKSFVRNRFSPKTTASKLETIYNSLCVIESDKNKK